MASTAQYTSAAQVNSDLPRTYSTTDLPASTDTTYTSLNTHITKASRYVDSALAEHFCTFNDMASTVKPPQIIQDITTWVTLSRCYGQLTVGGRNSAYGAKVTENADMANSTLAAILGKDLSPAVPRWLMIPNETVSTETLTWGVAGQYDLQVNEAFINVAALLDSSDTPYVIEGSVRVLTTGYTLYGFQRDFAIRFHPQHRKWVFADLTGTLKSSGLSATITYDWSWRRYTEVQPLVDEIPFMGGY